ncbi:MAG: TIGR00341 family protein [Actinomycetota bacterium]
MTTAEDLPDHGSQTPDEMTPLALLWAKIREREEWTDEEREQVLDDLFPADQRVILYTKRFATLIVLSTIIAAFGLIGDSAAVVIGAMLVAPLMTPMLALSASLMYWHVPRFIGSLILIVFGTIGAIMTGWAASFIAGGTLTSSLTPELLARTSPSLLDLGIAVAAGLAAGYVLTHKGAGASLPGVAIAVALVPPLATVGVALEVGNTSAAYGALLLYTTNLVAIVLSASVVMMVSGFVPDHIRQLAKGKIGMRLLPWGIALLAIMIPLGVHSRSVVADEMLTRQISDAVEDWDPQAMIVHLDTDRSGDHATVKITVATTADHEPAWKLADRITNSSGITVDLDVNYQQEAQDGASTG